MEAETALGPSDASHGVRRRHDDGGRPSASRGEFDGPHQHDEGGVTFWLSDDDSESGSDGDSGSEYERDDVDAAMGVSDRRARARAAAASEREARRRSNEEASKLPSPGAEASGGGSGRGRPREREDEDMLLYEDGADDADAEWANARRGGRVSDAILSCPCCLEIVTIDCQRHDRYADQFRAMFVQNIRVDTESTLTCEGGRGGKRGMGAGIEPADDGDDGPYNEVGSTRVVGKKNARRTR